MRSDRSPVNVGGDSVSGELVARPGGRVTVDDLQASHCDAIEIRLQEAAAGQRLLGGDDRRHVDGCASCRQALGEYRQLARGLQAMRCGVTDPPVGLLDNVLLAVDQADARPVVVGMRGRRAVYVSGLAAAATAAAGGALVLASRSRRRLRIAS